MLETVLESSVQNHLKKVYTALSMSSLVAGTGAYIHVYTDVLQSNFVTGLISLGFVFALMSVPHEPKKQNLRLSLLMGFSFFAGLSLGPLLDLAIMVEPSLVVTAFLVTCVIFVCFTLSAIYSRGGTFLYLGGTLGSVISVYFFLRILSIFVKSVALYQAYVYIGLFLFCGFVLYDTQSIIEKRRRGDTDYIWHTFDLFVDFLNIFRHILVILLQSQDTRRKKKDRD